MGLRLDDFLLMDRDEFEAACASFADHGEQAERSRWERVRLLGMMAVQPWSKKRLNAEDFLPLPWDRREEPHQPERVTMTKAEHRKRMEMMRKKLGKRY